MSAVSIAHLAHLDCPTPLRDLPAWLVWRFEPHSNPGGKPRKVPLYAGGGRRKGVQGSPQDRAQLVTFDKARAAAARRGMDGVGFAPLPEFGIVALDFDNCVTNGQVHQDLFPVLAQTYAEFSPSGLGIRAFFQGDLGDQKAHGEPYGFETFSRKGFVTVTGNVLPEVGLLGNTNTVAPLIPEVLALAHARFKRAPAVDPEPFTSDAEPVGLTDREIERALAALPTDLDYDKWIQVGMALHHETAGEGFEVWDQWSQSSPKYTSREYGLERWASFGKGGGRTVTMRSVLKMVGMGPGTVASAEEFEDLGTPDVLADAKPLRFRFQSAAEFASRPPPVWLIRDVLPDAGLVVLYGASGSGKSFLALDMACALARGVPWRGKRTRRCQVAYVAAEGGGGMSGRLNAYAQHHGVPVQDIAVSFLDAAPNLLEKKDAIDLVAGIKALGSPSLVVYDTFAQGTPGGNENSGEDVGKALAHCKRIHEQTGAVVMLVHHSGKDATKGARGWSGLKAAADAELEVTKGVGVHVMRTTKQKDGQDGLEWGFALQPVALGLDGDGQPYGSCVMVEAALPAVGGVPMRVLGPVETLVNEAIQEFAKVQTAGIEVKAVIDAVVERMPVPEGKRDTRKQHANRALKTLCADDFSPYEVEDGCITIL